MRRVVVTGLGMVSPLGCGVEETWTRLLAGESGASRVEHFDVSDLTCQIACMIDRRPGCAFAPRCGLAHEVCHRRAPTFSDREDGLDIACFAELEDGRP